MFIISTFNKTYFMYIFYIKYFGKMLANIILLKYKLNTYFKVTSY